MNKSIRMLVGVLVVLTATGCANDQQLDKSIASALDRDFAAPAEDVVHTPTGLTLETIPGPS